MTQTIGRYEIRQELGRGGMATVYQGFDPRFKRDVAIKLLPREFLHDPNFRARFEREATTIASLEHSAIVPVYDFGEEDGQPYLVMRFMPGGSLAEQLDRGSLSVNETARILSRIAGALDFAHSKGVIHRDLKPANILFDQHADAYLGDFGIVKLTEEAATLTGTGGIIGTPAYMSPEQAQGKGGIDNRSDLYSLGVILFQMLTGSQPFEADTPIGLAFMHVTEPTPDILEKKPELPPGVGTFIQQAMAKAKGDRFSTAQELAGEFERSTTEEVVQEIAEEEIDPTLLELEPTVVEPEQAALEEEVEVAPSPIPAAAAPAAKAPRPARRSLLPLLGIGGVIVIVGSIAIFTLGGGADRFAPAPEHSPTAPSTPSKTPTIFSTLTPTAESSQTSTPTEVAIFDPVSVVQIAKPIAGIYEVTAIAWSPDGSKLAAFERIFHTLGNTEPAVITIWDVRNFGAPVATFKANTTFPEALAWSPDGEVLASTGSGGTIQLWNSETWDLTRLIELGQLPEPFLGTISGLAWSADSTRLALGSADGKVRIWDLDDDRAIAEYCCYEFGRDTGSLIWLPDGETMVGVARVGSDFAIRKWEIATGEYKSEAEVSGAIAAVSPDGTLTASVGNDALRQTVTLHIRDTSSSVELLSWESASSVGDLDWSPDGTMLAAAGWKVVNLWDPKTGELVRALDDYELNIGVSRVYAVSWSPDGAFIAAGSADGTLRVWGMPAD